VCPGACWVEAGKVGSCLVAWRLLGAKCTARQTAALRATAPWLIAFLTCLTVEGAEADAGCTEGAVAANRCGACLCATAARARGVFRGRCRRSCSCGQKVGLGPGCYLTSV
jgi:hypothetical protein